MRYKINLKDWKWIGEGTTIRASKGHKILWDGTLNEVGLWEGKSEQGFSDFPVVEPVIPVKKGTVKRKRKISTSQKTVNLLLEVLRLYPNQDPIRAAAGIADLKMPPIQALSVLKKLAPAFAGQDLIRVAAGYNDAKKLFEAPDNNENSPKTS